MKQSLQAPTVMIVEDDAPVREALGVLFEASGYAVLSFASLESFLGADRPAGGCVVLDLNLGSTSAADVLADLEGRSWPQPTVIVSGGLDAATRQRAHAAGARAVLDKPADPERLLALIGEILAAVAAEPPVPI